MFGDRYVWFGWLDNMCHHTLQTQHIKEQTCVVINRTICLCVTIQKSNKNVYNLV